MAFPAGRFSSSTETSYRRICARASDRGTSAWRHHQNIRRPAPFTKLKPLAHPEPMLFHRPLPAARSPKRDVAFEKHRHELPDPGSWIGAISSNAAKLRPSFLPPLSAAPVTTVQARHPLRSARGCSPFKCWTSQDFPSAIRTTCPPGLDRAPKAP